MLSPDHVRVRRQGNELKLLGLDRELQARAVAIAREVSDIAREHVGKTRDEVVRAWLGVECSPRERRILSGLMKLVEDDSEFEMPEGIDPPELRSELFLEAARRRRSDDPNPFDRDVLVREMAERRGMTADAVEAALFADLRGAHRLVRTAPTTPEALVERYREAQVQAVLLRAVRVVAHVRCASPDAYRELFRKLKFRRLLHRISPEGNDGYRIEIDGPFSLFQGVAKYGLELSLLLPALEACSSLELEAEVRWSERGRSLVFRHRGGARERPAGDALGLRSEVVELVEGIRALGGAYEVKPAERIFDLPGIGVCVPDLRLVRLSDGAEAFVEVLGYWSRSSVWKRVELAESGLGAKLLFAVSSRLRVSEEVLEDSESAALYVYKGKMNPQAVLRKVEGLLAERRRPGPR
jgi:predicted nuclease of restriction endonuclease-like RecB superfamily